MSKTIQRPASPPRELRPVRPSDVRSTSEPFSMDQQLKPFGCWVDDAIWVPPKDRSPAMAETMLNSHGLRTPREQRWASVTREHRPEFTQVREIELGKASIRLPKGRFFVTVTEREAFDEITDTIPACVQTRLDEFLAGPVKRPGVKVYYLKPLCVEVDDELILTSRDDLMAAITKIKNEVFSEYRRMYLLGLPRRFAATALEMALAIPKSIAKSYVERRQKALDAYHAKLEFRRRKTALRAAKNHRKCFTTGCTFDDMLEVSGPLNREAVIEQFAIENDLSPAARERLLMVATALPWFVTFSLTATYAMSVAAMIVPPVMVCDPAFVAEMPDAPGVLLKIGHFDEVGGVTHIEI